MEKRHLNIGTRGSPLALTQSNIAIMAIKRANNFFDSNKSITTIAITTSGDRIQTKPIRSLGGKGLFTKELDEALLQKRIDIAIHSMKDIPAKIPNGIALHAIMQREDPRDAFVCNSYRSLKELPSKSCIGTSSTRRTSQILNIRPDLNVQPLRGIVETRLNKISTGEIDATILAYAGLKRLGKENIVRETFNTNIMLPALGQGCIAATCREDDPWSNTVLASISEHTVSSEIIAERAMLIALDGSCNTPIGGLARTDGHGNINLTGIIISPDGKNKIQKTNTYPINEAEALGFTVGKKLLEGGGKEILTSLEKDLPVFIKPHPDMQNEPLLENKKLD